MYFAELDENKIVKRVIVAESLKWCEDNLGGTWIETFMDDPNHNYAGVGYKSYDDRNFSAPQPFPSWTLNAKKEWQPPISRTGVPDNAIWDEQTLSFKPLVDIIKP